jgi:hypothetical protein
MEPTLAWAEHAVALMCAGGKSVIGGGGRRGVCLYVCVHGFSASLL